MKHFLFLVAVLFTTFLANAEKTPSVREAFPKARFEENKGQWHPNVQFRVELVGGVIFYEKEGYTIGFNTSSEVYESQHHDGVNATNIVKHDVIKARYIGSNSNITFEKSGKSEYYRNYFIGNDESKWASDVRLYTNMTMPNLYNGIDVRYSSNEKNIKYDVVVKPNIDPKQYRVAYEGQKSLTIDKEGNLVIANTLGEVKELKPYAYQIINGNKVEVKTNFVITNNNEVSFEFPNGYDTNYELIIDPFLVASTYTGATADNWGNTSCPGPNGQMRVAGISFAQGYPLTAGAYQTTFGGGGQDCAISFFSSNGTTLIASTYVGGNGSDNPHSIFSSANGDLYMVGRTESNNFPFVAGCYDGTFNGGTTDIFAIRLNASLTNLIGATYIGGSGQDGANVDNNVGSGPIQIRFTYADTHRSQMTIDNAGDVVIASNSQSTDFPVTAGAYDNTLAGIQDGVIIKLDNFLRTNKGATFIGGSNYDACQSLQIEPVTNNIFVTGATNSANFPTTAGVINPTALGGVDGFVFKMNSTLNTLMASSYLGTTNKDAGFNLDLDKDNNVHVYGLSRGGTYPTTVGTYSNANSCQFIHGLNNSLTSTIYSTKFGTTTNPTQPDISPTAFKVDSCYNIYAVGWGRNFDGGTTTGMPTTAGAFQTTTDGKDFYFITLTKNAGSLLYASFFGQNGGTFDHVDGGTSLFSDGVGETGVVYQAVCASCGGDPTGFPTTPGAYSSTNGSGNCNNSIFKFDLETYSPKPTANFGVVNTCTSSIVTFTNASISSTTYTWNFGDGTPISTVANPVHSYTANGTYTVLLTAFNPTTCITTASKSLTLAINFTTLDVTVTSGLNPSCASQSVVLQASGANTYTWAPMGTTTSSVIVNPSVTTNYTVVGTNTVSGCNKSAVFTLSVNPTPTITPVATPTAICNGSTGTLSATGASTYTWNPGSLSGSSISVNPTATTLYTVTGTSSVGCIASRTINLVVNSTPTVTANSNVFAVCAGGSATLTGSGAITYTWMPGSLIGSVVTVTPASSTNYTVTGSNASGCTNVATVSITVNSLPIIIATSSPTAICNGSTGTLTASGASTYTWSPGSLAGAAVSVSPSSSIIYTVNATDALGCSASQTVALTVNSNPTISAIANPTAICNGNTGTLTASGASTYTWNPGNLTGTSVAVTPTSTTNYTVTGTNGSGCVNTRTINLVVNPRPTINAVASPTAICAGRSATLTGSGASFYSWASPSGSAGTGVNVTVTPSITTTYTLNGVNLSTSCSNTRTVTLVVNPNPTITIAPTSGTICSTQSITLTGSGASTYTWNPGAIVNSTVSVSPSITTTYTLIGTSASGCRSNTTTAIVTLNNCPVAVDDAISTQQNTVVIAEASTNDINALGGTFTTSQPTAGSGTITMNPSTGQYTYTPNPTFIGTTTATYTLCNGSPVVCSSATITINVTGTAPLAVTDPISTPQNTVATGNLATNDLGANAINSPTFTVTQPTATTGTFVLNPSTGQYTFTPNTTFVGTGSTTYTLCNNTGSCSSTTITYTVTGDAPVAVTNSLSTPQNTVTTGNLATNDIGANAINSPTFTVTQPASTTGTFVLNPSTGQYTFTPNTTFVGTGSTTYTLCNNTGSCSSTTITYTVTGDAPVAVTNSLTTPQNTVTTGNLATNDLGANAINSPTFTVTQPAATTGTFVINPSTGQYTFTPNTTFVGTGSTTYTLCNNTGSCSSTTITYTVTGDAPVAVTNSLTTPQNTVTTGNLATNDLGANAINSPTFTVTQPAATTGTFVINPSTGQYTFTPNTSFVGTGSTTYTLCNNTGSCSSTTITYTVTGDAPVAVTNSLTTPQNTVTTGNLATNDLGANAINSPTFTVTQPTATTGTFVLNPSTGQYTFTPNTSFVGTGSTTYTLCNNTGSCSSTTITYTVTGDAPVAVTNSLTTPQNTVTTGNLATNDLGANAINSPTFTLTQPATTTGTFVLNPSTGQYTFTPNTTFVGTGSTTYTLCNNTGSCSSTTITYTVTGDAPVAVTNSLTTPQNTVTTGNLATNDLGANAINSPTFTVTQPATTTGTFVLNPSTGQYTFTPNTSFVGTGSTTYTLCNNTGSCSSTTITYTVTGTGPLAVSDATNTVQGTSISGFLATNDIGALAINSPTYTISQPFSSTGTININPSTGGYTYLPNSSFTGTFAVTYTLCNNTGACSSAVLTVTVYPTLVANDDLVATIPNTSTSGTLTTNDNGIVSNATYSVTITQPATTTGTFVLNPATGQYTFTPNPLYSGTTTTTYTICNTSVNPDVCSAATITILVANPVAVADNTTTPQGTPVLGDASDNDLGTEAIYAPITYSVGTVTAGTGTVVMNSSTGQYTYTPTPGFVGISTVTYTLCNLLGCSSTTITFTVTGTTPIAVTDGFATPQTIPTAGTLAANDTGANAINSPTFTVTQPASSTGTFVLNPSTGQYTFTPNTSFVGTGSTTYTLCNNTGSCSSTTITYTVTGDAPVAVTNSLTTPQNTVTTGNLATNDLGANAINSPTFTVTQPATTTGTFVLNPSTGQYTFTPNTSFVGTGSTTYTLCNNTGSCSSTTITYTVTGDAPVALTNSLTTPQNTVTTGNLATNDLGANAINSPTFTLTQPATTTGTFVLNPSTGQYTFTPNTTFVGTGSTTYTLCNNTGSCSSTTITYTVTGDAPVAVGDVISTPQNTVTTGTLAGNDTGANAINSPTYTVTQPSASTGTLTLNPSTGNYTFVPNPSFVGTSTTTYTLCNNTGSCSATTITITTNGVAPVAVTNSLTTPQNTVTTGNLATNDLGANAINSPTFTVTQPATTTGTFVLNPSTGQYTFTPNTTFVGTGSTTYTLCNNTGSCSSTTITYTVTGDAPVAVTNSLTTPQNTVTTGNLATNDLGANAINSPTFTVTQPATTTGTFVLNPSTGQYTFTPNPAFVGTGSTTYTLCNNTGSCSSTTITYTVTGDAPVAVTNSLTTPQNTVTTGNLATNDLGANAINSPTFTVTQPSSTTGTFVINPSTGQYTFTPNTSFVGTGSTTYTLCNNTGSCSSTTITYTVTGDAPVAVTNSLTTPQNTVTTGNLATNDLGANAINSPTFTVTQPATTTGTFVLNPSTGQYTFTPNTSFVGTGSTTYTLCNNTGSCSSTTITYTVTGDAPVAVTNSLTTPQNTVTTGNLATNDLGANAINSPTFTVTQPSSTTGTFVINPSTGQYTFTPNTTFVGTGSTTYTLCNNTGSCSSTTITYTVTGDAPVAVGDATMTMQGNSVSGFLSTNDTGDNAINSPTFTVTQPSSITGTINVNPSTGGYTYLPNSTFTGTFAVTYTLCNNTGNCSSAVLTVTVYPTLVANPDLIATTPSVTTTGTITTNDGGVVSYGSYSITVTQPSAATGTITLNPTTGQYTFTPNPTFSGSTTTTYTICNTSITPQVCSTTTITILVDNPIAIADATVTGVNTPVSGDASANDLGTGAIYAPISFTASNVTAGTGTLVMNPSTGQYTYTPATGFTGTTVATYTLCNVLGCSNTTISFTVVSTLNAVADATTTVENTSVSGNLATNDSGADAGASPVFTSSQPTAGTGTLVVNPSTGQYTFTPASGFTGTTIATYTLCNVLSPPCSTTTITFTVYPNLVANNDFIPTTPSVTTTGTLTTNDTGIVPTGNYSVTVTPVAGTTGTITVNPATGQYTFTPNPTFTGSTTTTYTICNTSVNPQICSTATITILVDTPIAIADATTTVENTAVSGDASTNDLGTGAIYAPISYTVGTVTAGTGTIVMNPTTGQYTYTPATGFTGTTVATYTLCNVLDCSTTTITFTVYPNLVANDDFIPTTPSVTTTGTLTTNDTGIVPTGNYSVTVTPVAGTTGTITVNPATGQYTFTPNPTFTGSTTTTYTICNTSVNPQICSTATITILVDTPIAIADATTTVENTAVSGDASTNDLGTGAIYAPISYTVGTVTAGTGTIVMNPTTGQYTYTPATGFTGTTVATYTLCNVLDCSTTTITFTVYPNLVANNDFIPTTPSVTTTGTLTTNDTGIVPTGNYSVTVTPVAGTTGTITVNPATGQYTFTPNPTFTGSTTTTYTICNTSVNPQICSTATITILVDTPIAIADATTTVENTAVSGDASTNDLGTGAIYAPISYTVGTVTAGTGTIVMNPTTGQYTYTPATGFTGTTVATYTLCNVLDCSTTTITFTVYPNLVANNDFIPTTPSVTTTGTLTTNDTGIVPTGNYSVTVTPVAGTTGTITVNPATGQYTFTPNPTFTGSTTTTYTICNTSVNPQICSTATITILVDTPIAIADATTTVENTAVSGNAGTNDLGTGAIYAPISYTVGTVTAGTGTIVMNPTTGQYTYTPATGFTGTTVATYTLCNVLDCSTTTITFTVYPNLVANNDFIPTTPSVTTTGTLTTNDTGIVPTGNYSVTVTPVAGTTGTITVNPATGQYTFTPNPTFTGSTTTTYTICNTSVNPQICSTATITILVDTPIAIADATTTVENTAVSGDASTNDLGTGAIYAPISYTVGTVTAGTGTIVMNPTTGQYTYTPATGFTGTTVATYTLCNVLDCSTTTITFTVYPNLVANNDFIPTTPSVTTTGTLTTNDTGIVPTGNYSVTVTPVAGTTGTITVNPATGQYTFTPNPTFTGSTTTTYTICNTSVNPQICSTATITILVDTPIAIADATTTVENTAVSGNAGTNDLGTGAIYAPISYTVGTVTAGTGTIVMNPTTGQYTYTPATGFTGTTVATYTLCNVLDCSTTTITFTVYPNLVANDDFIPTTPSVTTTGTLTTNDTGIVPTGNYSVTVTPVAGTTGTITVNPATGQYTFTPNPTFTGSTTTTYTICNTSVNPQICSTATITILVDTPIAIADATTTVENTAVSGDASTNDLGTGAIYAPISYTVGTVTAGTGTIVMNPTTGQYTYTPATGFTGTTVATYTLCNVLNCATTTISFTVYPTLEAFPDNVVTAQGVDVNGNVLTNDNGIVSTANYTVSVTPLNPSNGTITIDPATGQFTFSPNPTFTGTFTTTYTVCNTSLDPDMCSNSVINFTVYPNLVANPDLIATLPTVTTTGTLTTNDTGVVPNATYSVSVTQVAATIGTITVNPATGQYTFTPDASFNGTTTTTYTICNTSVTPEICSTSTITIIVDNPIAIADATTTAENTPVSGNASTNDLGTGALFAPITFTVSQPTAGTGTIVMDASGQYTYTPATGFTGTTVATYTLCNSLGCSNTTITFTVYPNLVANPDLVATTPSITTTGTLTTNDNGVVSNGTYSVSVTPVSSTTGTITVDPATGNYTFVPNPSFTGTTTTTYTICNTSVNPNICSTSTITILVDNPIAIADATVTSENIPVSGDAGINDLGTGAIFAPISYTVGTVTAGTGTIVMNPTTGQYTYTPATGFTGTTVVTYTLCNNLDCSSTTITFTVFPNLVANPDLIATLPGTTTTGSLATNDIGVVAGANYSVTVTPVSSTVGTITVDPATGQYTFVPTSGYTGTTTTTYTICNTSVTPEICSSSTITIVVDNPIAIADATITSENTAVSGDASTNDLGTSTTFAPITYTVGTVTAGTGTITMDGSTGQFTYTPATGFTGTTVASYTLCNSLGCSETTITFTVYSGILAVNDDANTLFNTPVTGSLATNDTGVNPSLNPTFTSSQPTAGTGTLVVDPATGNYTFTPASGFTGTTVATYTLCNLLSPPCSTATITFTVYPELLANPDLIATTPSVTTTGTLTINDIGVVNNATYSVSVTPVSSTTGTLTVDPATGSYTFTPDPSFSGTTTTTYTICNISLVPENCSSSTITIVVANPIAIADATTTVENTPVSGDASTNDLGTSNTFAPVTFTVSQPTAGTGTIVMDGSTGQYTYTPATGFTGTTVATYTLCNSLGCSNTTITFTVYPNLVANPDFIPTTPSVTTTGTLATNDNGVVTGGTYSITVTPLDASTGTLTVDPTTGGYTFTPNPTFTGTASTTYTICNESVNPVICSSATISILVDNPIAIADATTTAENTPVSGNAGANDLGTGAIYAPISYTVATMTAGTGTITMDNATGQYTYTPATGFTGTTVVTYTLCNNLDCSSTTITFTVYPNLVANPDLVATTPSVTTTGTLTTNDNGVVTGGTYTISVTPVSSTTGTLMVDPSTGSYTFIPNPTYTGTTTTTYTICNTSVNPEICSSATITIIVDNPIAIADFTATTIDTPVSGDASTNDLGTGSTFAPVTYTVSDVTAGTGAITMNPATGQYTFTPATGFTGTTVATYTLCNNLGCSSTSITIVVNPNIVANPDLVATTPSVTTTGTLTTNDTGTGTTFTVTVTNPTTGTLTVDPSTGTYTYVPDPTFTGTTTTTYTICNNTGCSSATITIIVDNPIAIADYTTTTVDTPVSGDASTNDLGTGSTFAPVTYTAGTVTAGTGTITMDNATGQYTFTPATGFTGTTVATYTLCNNLGCSSTSITIVVNPNIVANPDLIATTPSVTTTGTLTTNDTGTGTTFTVTVTNPTTGTLTVDPSTGSYTYTPDPTFTGTTSTTYTICNNTGCSSTTITIIVDNPIAINDYTTTTVDTPVSGDASANDLGTGSAYAPVTYTVGTVTAGTGTITMNPATGQYTFTPATGFTGTTVATYTLCNNLGCSSASITIVVAPTPTVLTANPDVITTTNTVVATGTLTVNDIGTGTNYTVTVTPTTTGTLTVDASTGSYTYTPDPTFTGSTSTTYTICNNTGCSTTTITIIVTNTTLIVANPDVITTTNTVVATGTLTTNDVGTGTTYTVTITNPTTGTLTVDPSTGSYTYTPDPTFTGTTSTTYTICNNTGCSTSTITIIVTPSGTITTVPTSTLVTQETIPKGFSPNQDGVNDTWVIPGVENYPNNVMTILNRWGNVVFKGAGYDNVNVVWDGKSSEGVRFGGDDLPEGTYFYILELGTNEPALKGYIYLKK